jgi:hypothetical protein
MTAIENQKHEAFFSGNKICFKETVLMLLKNLEKVVIFSLKIPKTSI